MRRLVASGTAIDINKDMHAALGDSHVVTRAYYLYLLCILYNVIAAAAAVFSRRRNPQQSLRMRVPGKYRAHVVDHALSPALTKR